MTSFYKYAGLSLNIKTGDAYIYKGKHFLKELIAKRNAMSAEDWAKESGKMKAHADDVVEVRIQIG